MVTGLGAGAGAATLGAAGTTAGTAGTATVFGGAGGTAGAALVATAGVEGAAVRTVEEPAGVLAALVRYGSADASEVRLAGISRCRAAAAVLCRRTEELTISLLLGIAGLGVTEAATAGSAPVVSVCGGTGEALVTAVGAD